MITAALLVTVLVASAGAATINQTGAPITTNVNMTTNAPTFMQTATIPNIRFQGAVAVETDDINVVGGDVANSSYSKAGSCEKPPSRINQAASPITTNVDMTTNAPTFMQTATILNLEVQAAGVLQTDDINVVVGDIDDSSYSKVWPAPRAAPGPAPGPRPAPGPNGPAPR